MIIGYGSLTNTSSEVISGQGDGVYAQRGVSVTNAGTISGGKDAIYSHGFYLTVDPGAVFKGHVVGASDIDLGGTAPGMLAGIGSKFTEVANITFAAGSEWTIEGNKLGLTGGQSINDFASGDTIVLDGFAAKSETYVSGVGLVLSDAGKTVTLDITGSFTTADFAATHLHSHTTIAIAGPHGLDLGVVLDPGNGHAAAEMGFLSPLGGASGFSLGEHPSSSLAELFAEMRGPNYAANYLPRAAGMGSGVSPAVSTISAHGFNPASFGLSDAQHDPKITAIPPAGFDRFA